MSIKPPPDADPGDAGPSSGPTPDVDPGATVALAVDAVAPAADVARAPGPAARIAAAAAGEGGPASGVPTGLPPAGAGAAASGSIEVDLSGVSSSMPAAPVPAPVAAEADLSRAQRAANRVGEVVSGGVGHLGGGLAKVGGGLAKVGDTVDKIPGATKLGLGHGVKELGDGLADVGESLSTLPAVARTPRGRMLVRSMLVGFILVFTWIAVIVLFNRRGGEKPDLRSEAEAILIQLREGRYQQIYDQASPRFQEVTLVESFARDMDDAAGSLGAFREIASVNRTDVHRGPSGKVVNVELLVVFERGKARGNVSFQWSDGRWKLLGIAFELLDQVALTERREDRRKDRVKAPPEVRQVVERVVSQLHQDKVDQVWMEAAPLFQGSVTAAELARLERERRAVLGAFRQVLTVTRSKKSPGGDSASVEALIEFDKATITASFGLAKIDDVWRLTAYRVVLPMPRTRPGLVGPTEATPEADADPAPADADAPPADAAPPPGSEPASDAGAT